jgi:NtrC-family two-component system response regulator AlgB
MNTLEIVVPPLRERREDILPLARRFLAWFSRDDAERKDLAEDAERALYAYDWPGNIRELRNAIERAVVLASGTKIGVELLSERIAGSAAVPQLGGDFSLDAIERVHIERVIARTPTAEEAARVLGIDASTLWRKRKKYEGG